MAQESQMLILRAPSTSRNPKGADAFTPPSLDSLHGAWHVTHSTLPMWKSNRNVVITYTPAEGNTGGIHDLVSYQPLNSDKQKEIHGFDTPDAQIPASYKWRGKGWLKVTSSQWEVLGYGDDEGGWAVTYFQKTIFTPAGIDVYAKKHGGFSEELLERIVSAIKKLDDADLNKIIGNLFAVKHDWHQKDHIAHKHY
jgi:hypothetical protein